MGKVDVFEVSDCSCTMVQPAGFRIYWADNFAPPGLDFGAFFSPWHRKSVCFLKDSASAGLLSAFR